MSKQQYPALFSFNMHNLYLQCLFSALIVGYTQVKAYPAEVCGKSMHREPRIIQGKTVKQMVIPWMASINQFNRVICGGVIVSDRFILSATHCFNELISGENFALSRVDSKWTVTLGRYNKSAEEGHSVTYSINRLIAHQGYRVSARSKLLNDIVLLELNDTIKWTNHIQPICLPSKDVGHFDKAIAAGWGYDQNISRGDNDLLRYVQLSIFTNDHCNKIYSENFLDLKVDKTQICARSRTEEGADGEWLISGDTNQGDSGGSLQIEENGHFVVVGITSIGTLVPGLGIYTRVFEYLDWINYYIREAKTGVN